MKLKKIYILMILIIFLTGSSAFIFYTKKNKEAVVRTVKKPSNSFETNFITKNVEAEEIQIALNNINNSILNNHPNLNFIVKYSPLLEKKGKVITKKKIAVIRKKLIKKPNDAESWFALSNQMVKAGDYLKSIEFRSFASNLGRDKVTLNNLGNFYNRDLKQYSKSKECLLIAIEKNPYYVISYINLFNLYNGPYPQEVIKARYILIKGLIMIPNNPELIELFNKNKKTRPR